MTPPWFVGRNVQQRLGGAMIIELELRDPPPEFISYLETCMVQGLPFAAADFGFEAIGAQVRNIEIVNNVVDSTFFYGSAPKYATPKPVRHVRLTLTR